MPWGQVGKGLEVGIGVRFKPKLHPILGWTIDKKHMNLFNFPRKTWYYEGARVPSAGDPENIIRPWIPYNATEYESKNRQDLDHEVFIVS